MGSDWHTDPSVTEYTCYVDGGCSNNGKVGAAAYGSFMVYRNDKDLIHEDCLFSICGLTRAGRATNNMAESISINRALTFFLHSTLAEDPKNKLVIKSDSELIINQINGYCKTRKQNLKQIASDRQKIFDKIEKKAGRSIGDIFVFRKVGRAQIEAVLGH